MDDEPLVLSSALDHGVTEENILHAYAYQMGFTVDESHPLGPLVIYVGPGASGVTLYEVGLPEGGWHGIPAIVHGMEAREKILRKVGL